MDYLLVALSVAGAGVAFGTSAPYGGLRPVAHRGRLIVLRLAAVVTMIVPGAMVSDLFGPPDSFTSLWRTAVALWLPGLVVALILGRGEAGEEPEGVSRP